MSQKEIFFKKKKTKKKKKKTIKIIYYLCYISKNVNVQGNISYVYE